MVRLSSGCWRRPCRVSFLGRVLRWFVFRLAVGAAPAGFLFWGGFLGGSSFVWLLAPPLQGFFFGEGHVDLTNCFQIVAQQEFREPCVFARVSLGQTTVLDKGFYDWCRNQKT